MWAKLKNVLRQRWVLSVIGLALIALLVWFAGDAIAIYDYRPLASAGARLGLIALLLAGVAGWEGWKRWRAWRANQRLLGALGADPSGNAALSQREAAELKKRFDTALSTLKQARFADKAGGGRNYLYQLPWYMFIGAPGSGKTTALVNSGLRFPLANQLGNEAVKGVGGTRNCDWWFTDEAVLLDTAGRYTTQTSNHEVDASAWMSFLGLLRRFRPHQPLNGAIVTLSISDLLSGSAAQRSDYAHAVRERIQELHRTLGLRLPIYVMVTKCDLMAGFSEFFGDLGREARGQVWGMTFPLQAEAAAAPAAGFEAEFDTLVQRMQARLLARLQEERDPQRRARIFVFPRQFAGIRGLVKEFLDEVFTSSAYTEAPLLRGVYFTSGTQEGTPLDRVLGQISRQWGLQAQVVPPAASSGRSFFLTRLLREVVFTESDVSGRTALIERRRNRLALALHGTLGVLALLLAVGWTVSFVRNKALIAQVEQAASGLRRQAAALPALPAGDASAALPLLDALRALPVGPGVRDAGVPWSMGLGLYQGGKLGSQAERAYADVLEAALLPRVALRLEQQIREATTPEVRYEALKSYLMLYEPKHLDAADFEAWVVRDWERALPRDSAAPALAALTQHLRAALALDNFEVALPMDRTLVEQTRRQLASAPLPQRAYSRLKRLGVDGAPDFRLSDATGPSGALLFNRASGRPLTEGVPGLFTRKGYELVTAGQAQALVKRLAEEESWVLGPLATRDASDKTAAAYADVQRLYLDDYVQAWDALLGDLRLAPTASLAQSIQAMTLLSAADSPLKQLLVAVAAQTRLAPRSGAGGAGVVAATADKVASAVRSTVDKLLGDPGGAGAAAPERPEARVDRHFEQLHRLVEGSPAPLDAMLAVLKEYEVHLRATDEAIKRGAPVPSDSAILARIRSEADRMPAPLGQMVNGIVGRSTNQAASGAQAGLVKAVAGEVGSYCRQAVDGRYPFARAQSKEVPLGDFARLFGPNGTFDAFVKTKLAGVVDTSGPVWKAAKLGDGVDGLDARDVQQFQRAAVIRDAFFASGQLQPAFSADLVLVKLDEGLAEVQLSADGQTVRLQPGAQTGLRLSWPSVNTTAPVRLSGTTTARGETPALRFEGPWALFRLFDAGRQEGGTAERMVLSFALGEHRAVFELRSPSVRNPLRLPEMAQFRCPG